MPDEEVLDLAAAREVRPGHGRADAEYRAYRCCGAIRGRFHRMQANLQRCGVNNVQYYQRDGRTVGRAVPDVLIEYCSMRPVHQNRGCVGKITKALNTGVCVRSGDSASKRACCVLPTLR